MSDTMYAIRKQTKGNPTMDNPSGLNWVISPCMSERHALGLAEAQREWVEKVGSKSSIVPGSIEAVRLRVEVLETR